MPPFIPALLHIALLIHGATLFSWSGGYASLWVERFSLEQGLSQASVQSIAQDQLGFLWIGTADGLNRYDGHGFKIFRLESNNPCSLPINNVYALHADANLLWIGGRNGGLAYYNEQTGCFVKTRLEEETGAQWIFTIQEDRLGNLWIASDVGVHCLPAQEKPDGIFRHYLHDPEKKDGLPHSFSTTLIFDRDGRIWVGTYGGLSLLDPDSGTCRTWSLNQQSGLPGNKVWRILPDGSDNLWVGTRNGLTRFNIGEEHFESDGIPARLRTTPIWDMGRDKWGTLWIGSDHGLYSHTRKDNYFRLYRNHPDDLHSLSDNIITAFFQDKTDILWFGSYSRGLNKFNPRRRMFNHVRTLPGSNTPFEASVYCVLEDRFGRIWAGTYDQGVYRLDFQKSSHRNFRAARGELQGDNVIYLYEDSKNRIWASIEGHGLNLYDPDQDRFLSYKHLLGGRIYQILEARDGGLWAGHREGLHYVNPQTGKTKAYHFDDYIMSLYRLKDGRLCLGALRKGFYFFDPQSGEHRQFSHDPHNPNSPGHNRVNAFFEDRAGGLWLGLYGGGLNRMDMKSKTFRRYSREDGLPNEVIYSILEDHEEHLWMSTNMGLSRFNPKTDTFRNYSYLDGLQSNEFNSLAYCKTRNGSLVFGGIYGLNYFHPKNIRDDYTIPAVVISDLYLYNRLQSPDLENSPLQVPMSVAERVVFDYPDDVITFEFAALHFANPANNRYAFKMEGLDREWIYTDASKRFATYTNPPAGNYTFRVKGSNQDGIWNDRGARVSVKVHPPPWKSPFALACYGIAMAALAYLFLSAQRRKLADERRLNERLEREVTSRTRELARKNKALENQYREMEALEEIIRTINNEVGLNDVIRVVMEQGQNIFTDADHSYLLVYDDDRSQYRVDAVFGEGLTSEHLGVVLNRQHLLERYISRFQVMGEGITLAHHFPDMIVDDTFSQMVVPQSMLCLVLGKPAQGVLALGSLTHPLAFSNLDTHVTARFREHAENAFARAKELEELIRTQQDLTEAAHAAGMAENAENVLHNVGNILNSVRTSGHLIEEKLGEARWLDSLKRLVAFLADYNGNLKELANEERSQHLYPMLKKAVEELEHQVVNGRKEGQRLLDQVQNAVSALSEQRQHAGRSEALLESVELNALIQETLNREMRTVKDLNAVIEYNLQDACFVKVDRTKINRVIYLLFKNATQALYAKYQGRGGRVTVATMKRNTQVWLRFIDDGVGLESSQLDKAFAPKKDGAQKVKSFGLHYCANVMRQMNGEIEIQSPGPGKGAVVTLKFPQQKP